MHTLQRLWQILRPIRVRLLLGVLTALAAAGTALAMPQLLTSLLNDAFTSESAGVGVVLLVGGAVAALGLLEAVFLVLRRAFTVEPSAKVEFGMRMRYFERLQRLPIRVHDTWDSGQFLSRAMTDLGLIRRWIAFGVIMLISDTFLISAGIIVMWVMNPLLALVFTLGAVPLMAAIWNFSMRFHRLSRSSQDQAGDLATNVEHSVHGIRVLKAFGRGEYALERFSELAGIVRETETRRGRLIATFDSTIALLPEIALGVALGVGLFEVAGGRLSVGELAGFFATATIVAIPVVMIGQMAASTAATFAALNRHWEVLDEPLTITDPAEPTPLPQPVRGELEFDGVAFHYGDPAATEPVLHDFTLQVRPGETMALVGLTGSGKSTVVQLVPRLFDVTAGAVRLDGIDVRELALDDLRRATAIAFEDATLFSGSVRDNVLLGVDPALAEEERARLLHLALDTADAGFAHTLPEGLDTTIGEQGLSLSGGQRQRLALARAIAARPAVLLLDDPLSALDTATEERVTARLRDVLRGTTTLVVAHRTSTVALADRVALIEGGRVVAVGAHDELLASSARYRHVMADISEVWRDLETVADDAERSHRVDEGGRA